MKQKKVLCAGIAAAMLMGLVPQTALAAENDILNYDFRTYDADVSGDGWDGMLAAEFCPLTDYM